MIEAIIAAIVPSLVDLVKNATADTYDKDAELQILLKMQRDISDAREKAALA